MAASAERTLGAAARAYVCLAAFPCARAAPQLWHTWLSDGRLPAGARRVTTTPPASRTPSDTRGGGWGARTTGAHRGARACIRGTHVGRYGSYRRVPAFARAGTAGSQGPGSTSRRGDREPIAPAAVGSVGWAEWTRDSPRSLRQCLADRGLSVEDWCKLGVHFRAGWSMWVLIYSEYLFCNDSILQRFST